MNCIFSIYLIVLSCMPCADTEASNLSYSSQKITSNTDKHSHDTTDACSPFCICNCCGSPVFVYYTHYNFSSFRNTIDTKVSEYPSLLTSSYFGSIWQPPQL
ncbi:DUF6660 family protein [Flavobacterium eburneipallidum]|uniref:DUF6660 family protein n=1 Tax=Flavobacterium eburneipallidum TaxID=3003263 RepID=UPI0022AC1824|nr:DUF6660 family protein [Flavobacterium eburneipallidum]